MSAVTPSGRPAWERANDLSTYGGDPQKQNYLSQGVIDPLSDVGAEEFSRMAADLAAVQRTAPFMTLSVQCDDSTPAAPTVLVAMGMVGVRTVSYPGASPPPGFPSAARNGNGDVTLTWQTSYDDPYGVAGALQLQHPRAGISGTVPGQAVCEVVSAAVLRVRCYNGSGSALSNAAFTVTVGSGT